MQKKLLDLYYDARTLEEEQGVNILFLAIGTLKWIDPNNATVIRYAPLVLVPVELERGNAAEKFKLRARHEDIAANLSLEAFLDRVRRYLMAINPQLAESDFIELRASRYRFAQPICPPGYLDNLPPFELPVKGLWVADTSYYYPEDRGISESIGFGRMMARKAVA